MSDECVFKYMADIILISGLVTQSEKMAVPSYYTRKLPQFKI